MSNVEPPQHFLELIGRLYTKRDEILESSKKLVDYAYKLEDCDDEELKGILAGINKEINTIVCHVWELAPHLENPRIIDAIAYEVTHMSLLIEQTALKPKHYRGLLASLIRIGICQSANRTALRPTPRSIKRALGLTVSPRDIKLLLEHHRENW